MIQFETVGSDNECDKFSVLKVRIPLLSFRIAGRAI